MPSGNYVVKVRNIVGESNGLDLAVKWSLGTVSWSNGGGSTAGAIVSITGGSGYPSSIDGVVFSAAITAGTVNYPVNIISCCSSNSISFEIPPAINGTTFTITFTGPVTPASKTTYTTYSTYTPTANITSVTSDASVSVGPHNITFAATNKCNATVQSIKLVSTIDPSHVITVPNGTWNKTGSTDTAVYNFSASLYAGSYKLLVHTSPYGYFAMNTTINVDFPANIIPSNQTASFNGGSYKI